MVSDLCDITNDVICDILIEKQISVACQQNTYFEQSQVKNAAGLVIELVLATHTIYEWIELRVNFFGRVR